MFRIYNYNVYDTCLNAITFYPKNMPVMRILHAHTYTVYVNWNGLPGYLHYEVKLERIQHALM